ncbi:hypothetical protein O7A70_11990 [Mesorhizobium sp. Cs1299R1N1]|uniref:hypothetical protein n=1 Tax=Mesorhizobium sp. Cs1299R1N1 TaxID=3015172 RepID=UPI00301B903F
MQRCDFGFRQIHFEFVGNALAIKYSDGGAADPLVEVFDITSGETAVRRYTFSPTLLAPCHPR